MYAERINLERLEMTVKIEATALSMPESLDSLKITPLVMHRIYFELSDVEVWYAIMAECRALYGKDWRTQSHVRRKLSNPWASKAQRVWFEVPDVAFATWIAVKHAVITRIAPNK